VDSRSNTQSTSRLFVLAGLALVWAFLIFWRLVYLQVVRHEASLREAAQQHDLAVEIPAERGALFDRTGRLLAKSLFLDSVHINPRQLADDEVAADVLFPVLGLDRGELLRRIRQPMRCLGCHKPRENRRGFMWVKRRISPRESESIRSLSSHLKWIQTTPEPQRYYPNGALAPHAVGTVDVDGNGILGLEQALDPELAGQPGQMRLLRDVRERPIESELVRPVRHGTSITVTLDGGIQFVAERELRAAALAARADSGSVVVMIPSTGEVLAFASFPSFDPNETPKPGESPHVRFNHAFSVPFEPGSVFKIVTLAAALDAAGMRPDDRIFCHHGRLSLFGRVIREAKKGFGWLSVAEVLEQSSNIGAIEIGRKVGDQRMLEYVRRMGFGQRTGLPLPAESAGTVRNLPKWTATSLASVAMGHEISATTLQLARACSVIASGGLLVKPRLVLRRLEPGGKWAAEPAEPPQRILKPETAIALRQIMEGVVLRGTGKQARVEGYSSGGKTGTAQIWDPVARRYTSRYNGSFVGFAPVANPAVVVAVALNGVREYGGVVAAPVFRKVATEALLLLDVPKDLPEPPLAPSREPVAPDDLAIAELSAPPEDLPATPLPVEAAAVPPLPAPPSAPPTPAQAPLAANGLRAPHFTGKSLRAVLEESLAGGVPVEIVGAGIARTQMPPGGAPLTPGQSVRVEFR